MTSLDTELAALHPRGEPPEIPARRPRWRLWFVVPLALAGLWSGAAQPGSVPPPDNAGLWGEYVVPSDSVREQCGDSAEIGPDEFLSPGTVLLPPAGGSGSACTVGLTRKRVKPPDVLPPEDPAKACAGLAGIASLDGWTLRFGQVDFTDGVEGWRGLFSSRNGWLLACMVSARESDAWFEPQPEPAVIVGEGDDGVTDLPEEPGPPAPRRGPHRTVGTVFGMGRLSEVPDDVADEGSSLVVTEQNSPGEVRFSVQNGYVFGYGQLNRGPSRALSAGRYTARLLDADGNELASWALSP